MKNKQNKTLYLNLQKLTSRLQERNGLINPLKGRGYKIRTRVQIHKHCSNNSKFNQCDSMKLDCSAQNFIFKHLGTKKQPHTCRRRHEMISFLLALRFYIYHTSVLALPENVSMSSRHKKIDKIPINDISCFVTSLFIFVISSFLGCKSIKYTFDSDQNDDVIILIYCHVLLLL